MELEVWARKLISDHKHPLVKFDLDKSKVYLPTHTEQETRKLHSKLHTLKNILNSHRVDRRSSRCKANWLEGENVAQLIHIVGTKFHLMGFQNKNGRFVFPEEALFLLETNRCEIFWNSISIPISQAYEILLNGYKTLYKYTVYRNLSLKGFDVQRSKVLKRDDCFEPPVKKIKTDEDEVKLNEFDGIFRRLQQNGPRSNSEVEVGSLEEYTVGDRGGNEREYSLHFMFDDELDPKIGFYREDNQNVFCSMSDDSPIFTSFTQIKLPYLKCPEKSTDTKKK